MLAGNADLALPAPVANNALGPVRLQVASCDIRTADHLIFAEAHPRVTSIAEAGQRLWQAPHIVQYSKGPLYSRFVTGKSAVVMMLARRPAMPFFVIRPLDRPKVPSPAT